VDLVALGERRKVASGNGGAYLAAAGEVACRHEEPGIAGGLLALGRFRLGRAGAGARTCAGGARRGGGACGGCACRGSRPGHRLGNDRLPLRPQAAGGQAHLQSVGVADARLALLQRYQLILTRRVAIAAANHKPRF
jgi:hypothetical protein